MTKGVPKTEEKKNAEPDLMELLKGISQGMESLTDTVSSLTRDVENMKTGGINKFKEEANEEDVKLASEARKHIDPKLSLIVNEMLGEDFGVELLPMGDRPGFRFSLLVPARLSDNVRSRRPVSDLDEDGRPTGAYKKDARGDTVFEEYMPDDRRSCVISSSDSYEAVRKHCDRVRGYIIGYFQKLNQPIPEFKVK